MRWVIAVPFVLLALVVIVVNARIAFRWLTGKKKGSLMPVIGGLSGTIGLLTIPRKGLAEWWWVPLIADFGSVRLLLGALWFVSKRYYFPARGKT